MSQYYEHDGEPIGIQLPIYPDDTPGDTPAPTEAGCMVDICRALYEWGECISMARAMRFIRELVRLQGKSPKVYRYLIAVVGNGFAQWDESYTEQGQRKAKSKQAAEQEEDDIIDEIESISPDLADALRLFCGRKKLTPPDKESLQNLPI